MNQNEPVPEQVLSGQVAVVAGATRGAGRGIARGLAEAGALVYCTGRSVTGHPSPYGRSETIDETARMILAEGGAAIAVRVDHTVEADVAALFERIDQEQGRVDILVNSIAGEDPMMSQWGSFWETKLDDGSAVFEHALLSHIITAKHAALRMIEAKGGLIVEVTESDMLSASGNLMSQSVRLSRKGLALGMAAELEPHGVAAVSITPGFLRSETMLEHFGVTEENWQEAGQQDGNFLESESPLYVGRAIAALAADPDVMQRTGQLLSSWQCAQEYGLFDYDGRRPDWGQLEVDFSLFPESMMGLFRSSTQMQLRWLESVISRTRAWASKLDS